MTLRKLGILFLLTSLLFGLGHSNSFGQVIIGKVIHKDNKNAIPYASIKFTGVQYKGKSIGVSANAKGEFSLAVRSFPTDIEVSAIGFVTRKITLTAEKTSWTIVLKSQSFELEEFVISADKITVEELKSPIQIEKLDITELKSTPSFNFFEAVANLKGVDIATQSIIISSVNARGFNSTTNLRFKQFNDGIDTQAPGLGFSLANVVGPNILDIESLELIPGPTTSQWGPGAFNGVLLMTTKNPFDYQGLSFEVKGATIAADPFDSQFISIGNSFIHDISVRYAKEIVKDKIAFKVNGSRLAGSDFAAQNFDNIGPGFIFETKHSTQNQSINGVNVYGDDRAALVVLPREITLPPPDGAAGPILSNRDTLFQVTRQGYQEGNLVDYNAENVKFSGALHVKLSPKTELVAATFYGSASTMITGDDRIALRDFEIFQHKVEIKNDDFLFRAYTTNQKSGNTFNVGKLGESIVQAAKPDEEWFNQYKLLQLGGRTLSFTRNLVDTSFPRGIFSDRFEPGTQRFDSLRNVIINSQNPESGAAIFDQSRLYHVESSVNIHKWDDYFENFTVGTNARLYDPESNGTIFTDSIGNDVTNFEFGFFVEATKKVNDELEVSFSSRIDKNENFNLVSSQRLSLVKAIKPNHFIRGSIQTGLRIPNVREQFFNQDLGDIRLVGGRSSVVGQYDLQGNAFTLKALDDFNQAVADEGNNNGRFGDGPLSIEALRIEKSEILRNGIVADNKFRGIKPERITSFEFGYRGLVEDKKLFEVVYYINHSTNFIGTTRVIKPRVSPSTDLQLAFEQTTNPGSSDILFVSDNAESSVITQGLELLYDVTSDLGTNFDINMTFANILQEGDDPLTPGFNTPPFKLNMTLGNSKISRKFGAEISWRYRSEFEWESSFADGPVPSFNTFDFQLTYNIPRLESKIRFGGNNVLNKAQFNTFGGPEITSFYYLSFVYGQL